MHLVQVSRRLGYQQDTQDSSKDELDTCGRIVPRQCI